MEADIQMKYKIKVYLHNSIQAVINDDIIKFREYFRNLGLDLTLDIEETNVPKQNAFSLFKEKNYPIIIYIYDRYAPNGEAKSWAFHLSKTLKGILLSTSKADDNVNFTWIQMAHEFTHCLFYMLADRGIYIQDPLDINWSGKGAYYKNDKPFDEDSNHAEARRRLASYYKLLDNKPMYFKPTENTGGGHTVAELKPELVQILEKIRGECGFPLKITSGKRSIAENNALQGSVSDSAHLDGSSVDLAISDSIKRFKLVEVALKNNIKRIGIGKDFVHLDIAENKPKNVMWTYY